MDSGSHKRDQPFDWFPGEFGGGMVPHVRCGERGALFVGGPPVVSSKSLEEELADELYGTTWLRI